MNLAKLFGLGSQEADDPPTHAPMNRPERLARPAAPKARPQGDASPAPGFDPYNSGAFRKNTAWERINRR